MPDKAERSNRRRDSGWALAYWVLFACWAAGAALAMSHVQGGFLTSYLSDLTFPPWFYILLRERVPGNRRIRWARWFGGSPGRAASSIFLVGAVPEFSQYYWPHGLFRGTYDPWDIAAYAVGLLVCYGIEKI